MLVVAAGETDDTSPADCLRQRTLFVELTNVELDPFLRTERVSRGEYVPVGRPPGRSGASTRPWRSRWSERADDGVFALASDGRTCVWSVSAVVEEERVAQFERLNERLGWHSATPTSRLVTVDDQPVVAFVRSERRVATRMVFLEGRRHIDVTVQPAAAGDLLAEAARRRRCDANAWTDAVAHRLRAATAEWQIDIDPDLTPSLSDLVAAAGFPVLYWAMARGVTAPARIPRWAVPILSAPTAGQAAAAGFGAQATRRLIRTLPTALTPTPAGSRLSLAPLAACLALREIATADGLANVLAAAAHPDSLEWLSPDQLHNLGRLFGLLGPEAGVALAIDSIGRPDAVRRLVDLAPLAYRLSAIDLGRPPRTLAALNEAVLHDSRRHELDRAEPPPVPQRRVRPREPALPAAIDIHTPDADHYHHPPAVLALDGACLGEHELKVPRNRTELVRWGRVLRNCIAGYHELVAAGRTVVVGVRRGSYLVAALELDPALTTVRQFVREQNERPHPADRAAVSQLLTRYDIPLT